MDIIKKIADKVSSGVPVALYGVSSAAVSVIHELRHRFQAAPVYICDRDLKKWEKAVAGVKVVSLETALNEYPQLNFYITSHIYLYQVIGELHEYWTILPDRILNYEPVEGRKSCIYLESQMTLMDDHKVQFCCSDWGKNCSPKVDFSGDYNRTAEQFVALRDELIDRLQHGEPTPCDGCMCLSDGYFPKDHKIGLFHYAERGICNFTCSYCVSPAQTSTSTKKDIDAAKMLRALDRIGALSKQLHTDIANGEVTLHPERKEVYSSISDAYNIVFTNASVYDEGLAELMAKGKTALFVSVDAGTRETFQKVKGLDSYQQVCDNLQRYAAIAPEMIELKFIVLPGINDNEADVDGFCKLCEQVHTQIVSISFDVFATEDTKISAETTAMAKRMIQQLESAGIIYKMISDVLNRAICVGGTK